MVDAEGHDDQASDNRLDPRMQNIGEMNRGNVKKLLSSLALYPLTQKLNMPLSRFEDLIARARNEADTTGLKAYFPL